MTIPNTLPTALALALALMTNTASANVTRGTLVAREGRRIIDLPLEHTSVSMQITGTHAEVSVTQRFTNPYAHKIEAIYAFPLPSGAAVDRLELRTGSEVIRGSIHRRAEAKRIYERAKVLGKIASLLEQEGGATFTQSVANIEPGAKIEVELRYSQEVTLEDERYELVFPMVVTPRPISSSKKSPRFLPPDVRSGHDIALTAKLDTGIPIKKIHSPSHQIEITENSRVEIAAHDNIPNKDFVLRWELEAPAPAAALIADGRGTFMMTIQPPRLEHAPLIAPRELVFALDTSSSMTGAPIEKAKSIIRRALTGLQPDDTFQLIAFADRATKLADRPIANKPQNIEIATRWLNELTPAGGTEMLEGIRAAFEPPGDPGRLRLVVFLTDGYVGNEEEILRAVAERINNSRIFTFGIGSAVNRYLLEELADLGRGVSAVLRADENESRAVEKFHDRIAKPVMTDLAIDWGGLHVEEVVPTKLPDLFAGRPIAVHGRYGQPGRARVMVSGSIAGQRVEIPIDVELTIPAIAPPRERAQKLAPIWAKTKIRELSRALLRNPDKNLEEKITTLALEHSLLTPFTAFIAVSEKTTGGGPAKVVPIPVEAPEGLEVIQNVGLQMTTGSIGAASGASGYSSGYGSAGHIYNFALRGTSSGGVPDSFPMSLLAAEAPTPVPNRGVIHKHLEYHRSAIKYCYEKQLQSNPSLQGRLDLNFTVQPDGKVSAAKISNSTLKNSALETCVLQRIKSVKFPGIEGSAPVVINMPYVFRAPEQKGATP